MRKNDSKKQNKREFLEKLLMVFHDINKNTQSIKKSLEIINIYRDLNNCSDTFEPPFVLLD